MQKNGISHAYFFFLVVSSKFLLNIIIGPKAVEKLNFETLKNNTDPRDFKNTSLSYLKRFLCNSGTIRLRFSI